MSKKHHLPEYAYSDTDLIFLLTTCVHDPRDKVFGDPRIASIAQNVLEERASFHAVPLHTYVIMPDHVHLVLQPSDRCGIHLFMRQFKSLTTRAVKDDLGFRRAIWQTSYHDRRIKNERHYYERIAYVLHNPVRRSMVDTWDRYVFSGSLVHSRARLAEIAAAHVPSEMDNPYDE